MSRRASGEHAPLLGGGGEETDASRNKRCSSPTKALLCVVIFLAVVAVIVLMSLQLAVTWKKLDHIEVELGQLGQHHTSSNAPTTTTISPWSHPRIQYEEHEKIIDIPDMLNETISVISARNGTLLLGYRGRIFNTLVLYDTVQSETVYAIEDFYPFFFDAILTPEGNILYSSPVTRTVYLSAPNNTGIIQDTLFPAPRYLTLAENGKDIYLGDRDSGAYKSTDGGRTWVHVYLPNDGWECWKFFALSPSSSVYWSYEILSGYGGGNIYRLVMSVDAGKSWGEISIPSDVTRDLIIDDSTILTYDGKGNFIITNAGRVSSKMPVHVMGIDGHYEKQFFFIPSIYGQIFSADINRYATGDGQELYVGGNNGRVRKFLLYYYPLHSEANK